MTNYNQINKYHTIFFFLLSLSFLILKTDFQVKNITVVCFFLIATIGVSHGSLDNFKGAKLLKILNIKNKASTIIKFLSNKSNILEDILIILKMPKWIFVKAIFKND